MQEERNTTNRTPFSSDEMKSLVVLGRALSDLTRIRILGLLAARSMYGQELAQALEVAAPTISHHMEPLLSAGLVQKRRGNKYHYYEMASERIQQTAETTPRVTKMIYASAPLPTTSRGHLV